MLEINGLLISILDKFGKKLKVTATEQQRLVFDKLVIDPGRREVTLNNEIVPLTALEFDLLHFLACHPDP